MLEIEIDGKSLQVAEGSTIMDAAHEAGTYIPHFCYHKKLSIAANCRMCLVQVEKAPKPLPACATPVSNGMKVFTHSDLALKAQKGVMEFLLINHPLDCPICDQGGECQLQDLAVGYGSSASRYQEEKRVVFNKNLGPLVNTDMTRCIHCTRCVRFTTEIAGEMEMGQAKRGEHAEIMPFIEKTVDSELSGNIIDLCPVGALTSKPFRYAARTWELARRKSVAPHDGLGSNIIVQVKHDKVLRVLPLENESINECWLSDKDRFSYEGLNSPDRLTKPMVKQGGQWVEAEWNVALDYLAHALRDVVKTHGAESIGTIVSPHSTLEEMFLAQKVTRALGSENVDFRLRQSDFSLDGKRSGTPWLGTSVAEFAKLDRVLVVGSFLRKDHPLLAQRLRQSAKRGTQVSIINSSDDDQLIKGVVKAIGLPSQLPQLLAEVVKAVALAKGAAVDPALANINVSATTQKIADSLLSGTSSGVFLGNFAQQHPQSSSLEALVQQLASLLGAKSGFLGEAANSVGGYVAKAIPGANGMNAAQLFAQPRKAYMILNAEPELDSANGAQALEALKGAAVVAVFSAFKSEAAMDYADVLFPIAPFSETSGTFISTEGRVQSFNAVAKGLGESRPGWKVLRVLGNVLDLPGFEYNSSEDVKKDVLGSAQEYAAGLDNKVGATLSIQAQNGSGLERIADVPIYYTDSLVRRSPSLQAARDAAKPVARINPVTAAKLGLDGASEVVAKNGVDGIKIALKIDTAIPEGAIRVASSHASTIALGAMFGQVSVERA